MTASAPPTELGFDLTLTEEQQLAQRTAREFATDKVLPLAAQIDANAKVPPELLSEMGALGFMGIAVPERWGGAGLDTVSAVLVMEEINRACASTGVVMSVNNSLVCQPLLRHVLAGDFFVKGRDVLRREIARQQSKARLPVVVHSFPPA